MKDQQQQAQELHPFERLRMIIQQLRSPDGCPWDREQTAQSLKDSLVEEAYECVDAIIQNDNENLREELGDLYMLVTMIAYIKQQEDSFSVDDVLTEVSDKLIRRHPHVFGDSSASTTTEIINQWEKIKVEVEGKPVKESVIDGVRRSLPPLERAYKIQQKASKVGFDWEKADDVRHKVTEELDEVMDAANAKDTDSIEQEIGDLLFSVINLSRFLGVAPGTALHRTNEKFARRFRIVEMEMKRRGKAMSKDSLQEMDSIWNSTKKDELLHTD